MRHRLRRKWGAAGGELEKWFLGALLGSPGVFTGTALLVLLYTGRLFPTVKKGCALKEPNTHKGRAMKAARS